jgi:hypothetical protein
MHARQGLKHQCVCKVVREHEMSSSWPKCNRYATCEGSKPTSARSQEARQGRQQRVVQPVGRHAVVRAAPACVHAGWLSALCCLCLLEPGLPADDHAVALQALQRTGHNLANLRQQQKNVMAVSFEGSEQYVDYSCEGCMSSTGGQVRVTDSSVSRKHSWWYARRGAVHLISSTAQKR